jgi:regulatory protein
MEKDIRFEKAKQKAFRLLTVRARSKLELQASLKEKGFEEDVVKRVTARLLELKYLDDQSFATQYARDLAINRLCGNKKVEAVLLTKGIDRALIEQSIAQVRNEVSEKEAIRKIIKKKIRGKKIVELDRKEKGRLSRNLMGKGFPAWLIFEELGRPEEEFIDDRNGNQGKVSEIF